MATVMKHVGSYGEKPCVVLFRELPGEPENCLIIQSTMLDSQHHDDLMAAVQLPEAQQSNDLSQVLHRKSFTDGTNMLNYLHFNKKLQKVPVSMVNLVPLPGRAVPLSEVNAEIRKLEGGYVPPKTDGSHNKQQPQPAQEAAPADEPSVAVSLVRQAELMKADAEALLRDAEAKLSEAYQLDPSLVPTAPKKRGRPSKTTK